MVTLTISADPLDEAMRERADALAEEARMDAEEARRRRLHLRHWQQHYDDEGLSWAQRARIYSLWRCSRVQVR